ncbi:MAG: hypothetical protein ACOYMW_12385 [Candidatus Competibacteraceae bacterium]
MLDRATLQDLIERAERIFLHPQPQYSWKGIIVGVAVMNPSGHRGTFAAVGQNTWRGFHKVDKERSGAAEGFRGYFLDDAVLLQRELNSVASEQDLDCLEDDVLKKVKARLINIKPGMLQSYNKIRKPLDLYFEHLVAMASELSTVRQRLIPLLRLPLDSQMFQSPHLFSDSDLRGIGLSRQSTFHAVKSADQYQKLQTIVKRRADQYGEIAGQVFYPIYFDLWWNDRYRKSGGNLFEVNLG